MTKDIMKDTDEQLCGGVYKEGPERSPAQKHPHATGLCHLPNMWIRSSPQGKLLSHVRLFVTPWTVARQAPLLVGFSRQEYQSGSPFPSPSIILVSGMKHNDSVFL